MPMEEEAVGGPPPPAPSYHGCGGRVSGNAQRSGAGTDHPNRLPAGTEHPTSNDLWPENRQLERGHLTARRGRLCGASSRGQAAECGHASLAAGRGHSGTSGGPLPPAYLLRGPGLPCGPGQGQHPPQTRPWKRTGSGRGEGQVPKPSTVPAPGSCTHVAVWPHGLRTVMLCGSEVTVSPERLLLLGGGRAPAWRGLCRLGAVASLLYKRLSWESCELRE